MATKTSKGDSAAVVVTPAKTPAASKTPAAPKEKAARRTTGNLPLADAMMGILREVQKGRKTRTELKDKVPYGNYTALCAQLLEEGLIKAQKTDEDKYTYYDITAKGRQRLQKKDAGAAK